MFGEGFTTFIQMFLLVYTGSHSEFDKIFCKDGMSASDIQNLRTGDLILRTGENKLGSLFYHAGVYCGREEVIDFSCHSLDSWSSSSTEKGIIKKKGIPSFIQNKPFCVLRLRSGIPENFNDIVKKAMNHEEDYNLLTNNCLHFALRLLGVRWINHNIIDAVDPSIPTNWWSDFDFYGKAKKIKDFLVEEKHVGLALTLLGVCWINHAIIDPVFPIITSLLGVNQVGFTLLGTLPNLLLQAGPSMQSPGCTLKHSIFYCT